MHQVALAVQEDTLASKQGVGVVVILPAPTTKHCGSIKTQSLGPKRPQAGGS
jgi:hypothetical protein